RDGFRRFAGERIAPHAGRWDREEAVPREIVEELAARGWLGAPLPVAAGGGGMDPVVYGLLTEEIGRACSSTRSLLTVHDMVTLALARWGSAAARAEHLAALGRGERIAALALSEPEVGSDAAAVTTAARRDGEDWVLDGEKRWITFGQIADLFLVFAAAPAGPTAFLVPAGAPGLSRRPIRGVVGTRASLLAELTFDGCRVPDRHRVGREGMGVSHVAATALDHGRYSVAWGSVGIAQACLDASLEHTERRVQFGRPLREHQLVQRMLTRMSVDVRAARLLCCRAGHLRRSGDPGAAAETLAAKYFASRAATAAAADAVQLHGARGMVDEAPVARFLRDARVMEVIEGSTQILEGLIPRFPAPEL
ncbi:MAG TPA: acyl-CoA dehydrogenase family protein, partial [Thermoanaerobaculia bacterium]|nr:acyl-CoA dehydrogenase family protein [Thermoanaerobaculia bacterium]